MFYLTIWRRSCFIFAAIFNQVLLCVPECFTEAGSPQCFFADDGTFRVACRWCLSGRWSKFDHIIRYKQYEVSDVTGLLPNEMFRTNLVTHGASYDLRTENDDIIRYYPYVRQASSGCFWLFFGWCPTCLATSVNSWLDPDYRVGSSQFLGGLYGVLVIICKSLFSHDGVTLSLSSWATCAYP